MHALVSESEGLVGQLDRLREKILTGDNGHCFVEREEILTRIAWDIASVPAASRYAHTLEQLLAHLSTLIGPEDIFLGRMVEGACLEGCDRAARPAYFSSMGHTTLDWPALLEKGLDRIALEARAAAEESGAEASHVFAINVDRCCRAVVGYAKRYAAAARAAAAETAPGRRDQLLRAAKALEQAPAGPAPDFFSALQAMWIVHLVISCAIGARDFCFGRIDQTLLTLYRQGMADGSLTRDQARAYMAHFFLKTKEITGTATDNYRTKPTPSHASNQYLVIGGRLLDGTSAANELSTLVLEAACMAQVPQPEINVRIDPGSPPSFKHAVAQAMKVCASQINLWNDSAILSVLLRDYPQIAPADAYDYAFTACNRINLPGQDYPTGWEHWHVMPRWLLEALEEARDFGSMNDLLERFRRIAGREVGQAVARATQQVRKVDPDAFHFESILLQDCIARARDLRHGGLRYVAQYHLFAGLATVADSLLAIRRLVYEERRYALAELMAIVRGDFVGHEALRQEILQRIPKYGNGDADADEFARRVSEIALDALLRADNPDGHLLFPALYSLHHHIRWGRDLPATPDGRCAGEPISENQSPSYGADRAGLSALLLSAAALPHERTVMGGLSVKFGGKLPEAQFTAMLDTYFGQGGLHLGLTCVDRATLLDARAHPERYQSLCVRVTGFSEYLSALSPEAQQELIDRTAY